MALRRKRIVVGAGFMAVLGLCGPARGALTLNLDAASDSGVILQPATFADRITNEATPTFFGFANPGSIVRLYATNAAAAEMLIAETVALAGDGRWVATSNLDLTGSVGGFSTGGLRTVSVTSQMPPGAESAPVRLEIFLDRQAPQVTGVFLDPVDDPAALPKGGQGTTVSVFGSKPVNIPTPLARTIIINFRDLPVRATGAGAIPGGPFQHPVLSSINAVTPGKYRLEGDLVGAVAISSITYVADPFSAVAPAGGYVTLAFATPLPDDRYTLTTADTFGEDVGNRLDGESNAIEPLDAPSFPTGDGQPGGAFEVRFTVDSRPEVGTFSGGSWYIDLNGDGQLDFPSGGDTDATNGDLVYVFGQFTDLPVVGSWDQNGPTAGGTTTDGFHRVGVYGERGGQFTFELDLNGNGAFDPDDIARGGRFAFGAGGTPISGHWMGAGAGNDDRIGVFTGTAWQVDLNGNHVLDPGEEKPATGFSGVPVAGDWSGTGVDRVGTFSAKKFFLDMNGDFKFNATDVAMGGRLAFGFTGRKQRPVAADWDGDRDANIGLFVRDLSGIFPGEAAEWYLDLGPPFTGPLSAQLSTRFGGPGAQPGRPGDGLFQPPPTGGLPDFPNLPFVFQDIFLQLGAASAAPIAGNFDPPHGGDDHVDRLRADATPILVSDAKGGGIESGRIETRGDRDVFQVTPARSGRVAISVLRDDSELDTRVTVFHDRVWVARNNDFGVSTDSRVELDVIAGEIYLIRVSGARATTGGYDVLVELDVSTVTAR